MARDYATTNVTIWNDSDWRAVPFPAQGLYQLLWTHPTLNYCGVMDWRPARLTPLAGMMTTELVLDLADCLQARHFIIPDTDSEEVLLRSWVRWDGLMRKPRMAISWVKAYAATASNTLRGVVVSEGQKLRKREPDLPCWADPRVAAVLENEAIEARDLPVPSDPFASGLPASLRSVCDAFAVNPKSSLRSATPAPAPAPTPTLRKSTSSASADGESVNLGPAGRFGEFWELYPKKVNKQAAQRRWATATKRVDPQVVIDGLAISVQVWDRSGTDKQFIPAPDVWLNKGKWEDELETNEQAQAESDPFAWCN